MVIERQLTDYPASCAAMVEDAQNQILIATWNEDIKPHLSLAMSTRVSARCQFPLLGGLILLLASYEARRPIVCLIPQPASLDGLRRSTVVFYIAGHTQALPAMLSISGPAAPT
jgi:hypothetical protein